MSYFTLSQIKSVSNVVNFRQKNLERKSLSGKTTVFLSHSHKDADIIEYAIEFLLSLNVLVYVDWLDPTMPQTTSGETAGKIKDRINQCEKFVVLLSENSKDSKWVPWELGFADGKKANKDIAILPIKRSIYTTDSEFNGLEYMQLYRRIKIGTLKSSGREVPSIFPPDGNDGLTVEDWLG
ncbi:MAG: toll/interleukin-1 receptor domain-containing protein [Pyrinomonadaceae bacterium]|nr:toll/interleukin-1 receptor domain-containing protein [Pyrinomonadaceae bacterium]